MKSHQCNEQELRVRVSELDKKNEEQGVQLVKLIEEGKLKDMTIEE